MRTKVMSWLLALCLMVGLLPATTLAAAAPGTSSGTVIYVSESGDDSAAGDENAPLKQLVRHLRRQLTEIRSACFLIFN